MPCRGRPPAFWPWLLLGALSQIAATALMLLAMDDRSFVATTAYIKTEAIQTAIFGFVFLGDHLTVLKVIAILIATIGVVITALRPGSEKGFAEIKPTIIGLVAAAFFALSAIGFRGAIITVPGVSFVTAATLSLVWGLFVQTLVLTIYLLARAPEVLQKNLRAVEPSMLAGFMGAFASQFWFLAFALTAAANVRTLALVEVLFAQAVCVLFVQAGVFGARTFRDRADREAWRCWWRRDHLTLDARRRANEIQRVDLAGCEEAGSRDISPRSSGPSERRRYGLCHIREVA